MKLDSTGDDLGRIVVVAAGFALWKGGRCIAAARWGDIKKLSAYRIEPASADVIRLVVELNDGTQLEYHELAPGFDAFLDRASVILTSLLPFAAWHPALMLAPPGGDGRIIYEKPVTRR